VLDPRPEVPAEEFLPPSPFPREKITVFGSPNGTIPTGIRSNGCKLTSLVTG
ncbi:hypothetical protein A2U01_0099144, partial [Trifolium medium]|nr:hypothetical protein [Trifolium medium]